MRWSLGYSILREGIIFDLVERVLGGDSWIICQRMEDVIDDNSLLHKVYNIGIFAKISRRSLV